MSLLSSTERLPALVSNDRRCCSLHTFSSTSSISTTGWRRPGTRLAGGWVNKMRMALWPCVNYSSVCSHLMEAATDPENTTIFWKYSLFFLPLTSTRVSFVSRTITPRFATWIQRECVTALRFPWVDPPSSCTTAWPNSWLTPCRDHSRATLPTAFWRATTPRTLRQLSNLPPRDTCLSENSPWVVVVFFCELLHSNNSCSSS